ncbi:MAG: hypothetical protein K2F90_03140 [Clostridiales bacterium]|nr:hypothetical protein [Clostridiales bacterium]
MNKEQAQIYVNNFGQPYKHYTKGVYFGYLVMTLAFLGAAVGFCHELPMVIIVCALAVFAVAFTVFVVKKYMSVLRMSICFVIYLLLWAVAINCIAYAIQFYDGSLVMWEYCLCIAIQAVVFAVSAIVCFVVANKAKPKKIMVAGLTTTATFGSMGVMLSRSIGSVLPPDSGIELIIFTVLVNILSCILMACIAIFFVRIVIMRKHHVAYQQPTITKSELYAVMRKCENVTVARGFAYGAYTFYIYAKRDKYSLEVYRGNVRIQKENYTEISFLIDNAKIDNNYRLSKIWNEVRPI